ncbi:MAG: CvpA family protein [Clostridia bacterium]
MLLDLIIVLIIVLFTFIGYKRGLVKTAINILSFFIALIISITLYKTVGNIVINNTEIDEKIEATITSKITAEDLEEKYEILPNGLVEAGENTINDMAKSLTEKIIYIGAFIILFIVLKIALIFVKVIADFITKLPVIKQFDKTGGIIYGLAKGILIVTVIFAVISLTAPMINEEYINTINNSVIGSLLYNHNLLIGLIK